MCSRELPSTIEQVQREWKDKGLTVLAVNIEEGRETVAGWVKAKALTSTVVLDGDGAVTRAYEVTATPTAFLVGRDGTLVAKALGSKPWADGTGRALFALLTGG
ncbi:MAG: TlpA disulfide reductase family protein [Candidatus Rokuibacteriota bacterium]